jgi:SAM-dependent methyltransferase
MDVRRKQDHVENIQSVCANAVELPFAENTFDLVILNGVLEWTGLADPNENPLVLHKKIIKKIHHILKPGGKLYIGIENRFGIDCLMGVKDPHSGLRFVTVLPRWLADIYSKSKRGHRYSEITHSYWGMKKLLRTSGFKRTEFFIPLPNYRYFAYFIPFNNNQGLRFCVNHFMKARMNEASGKIQLFFLLVRILVVFKLYFLLKSFSPSFSLLAQKEI